jgi:hypothetical protein
MKIGHKSNRMARQQSRFYNLMDGLTEATTLYNNALQATGTTNEKFGIYLESNEAKANKLKATWEELFLNTFNSEQLGNIIELGTSFVQLTDGIGLVNIAIIALTATIIIFSNNIVKSLVAVQNFIKGIATMNWTLAAINPIVAGLALAIGGLIIAFNLYEKHQVKMYQNTIKNAKAFSDESAETDKLMNSISDLASKEALSVDEKTRMGKVTADLQKLYPNVLANLDLEKLSYEDLAIAVKKATDEKRREALQDIENEKTKLKAQINNVERETFSSGFAGVITPAKEKATSDRIDGLKKKLSELNAMSAEVLLGGSSSNDIEGNRLKYGSSTTKTPNTSGVRGSGDKTDEEKKYQSLYNTIRDLNFELDKQNEILSQTEEASQIPILEKRNKMVDQQKINLHALNVTREKELSGLKKGSDRYQELTDKIQETSLEWWKLDTAQNNNIKTMEEINKKAKELAEKTLEEQTKNLEDVQKSIIEIIKKRYELEKDEAEKAHKDKIDQLDDELDTFKDNMDKQMDILDKYYDKKNFEQDQNKATSEISKLTNERNTLSMAANSGDLVAKNRIDEIDEKLAKERENLSDLQQDREHDLRKQNLQDIQDAKEKEIKTAKEIAEANYETVKANYDKLLTEGNLYAEANKALTSGMVTDINGKLTTVQDAFQTFSNKFGETLGTLGKNIQTEFVDKLNNAIKLMESMQGLSPNSSSTSKTSSSTIPKFANGGIADYTGGAILHGTPSAVETILNATQGKKLFDFIQNLPMNIPSFNMPKIPSMAGASGSGNGGVRLGDVILQISGSVDKNLIPRIAEEVAKAQRKELNLAGIFRK